MKAFRFQLARVLKLREGELKGEESKLEALWAQQAQLEREQQMLDQSLERAVTSVRTQEFVRPSELVSLQQYHGRVEREKKEWAGKLAAHASLIEQQKARVVQAKMRVRMLEKLKEKRHDEWQVEADRELAELTADFSAAQWVRLRAS